MSDRGGEGGSGSGDGDGRRWNPRVIRGGAEGGKDSGGDVISLGHYRRERDSGEDSDAELRLLRNSILELSQEVEFVAKNITAIVEGIGKLKREIDSLRRELRQRIGDR